MINDLNNVAISDDREEEIHAFYVRYSNNIDMELHTWSKYLLENCVQRPNFDDPPFFAFYDSMIQLETTYKRFESNGTIED